MAISLGVLVGIIAGTVGLTSLTIILVVLGLRHKHRRLLSQINSAAERRLSSFRVSPSAIMSITDEDVARMPGTRASVRRTSHTPYNRNSLYTPMASRESVPPRAYIPKARLNDRDNHSPVTPQQSWPLPRRMTRADGTPLVKIPSATLTRGTERLKIGFSSPPPKVIKSAAGTPSEETKKPNGSFDLNGSDVEKPKSSSSTNLTPKPLFHGQHRFSSSGMISDLIDGSRTEPRVSKRISQFPKSKSMYSQEPGLAPPQPLPPLPFEMPSKSLHRAKSPDQNLRRASGGSVFSEQTSILDDQWSKAFSQAGTDLTSITLVSPPIPASATQGSGQRQGSHVVWESACEDGNASPIGAAKQMLFRPQLITQRSFRASIQESLPRSKSSGLSLSMSLHGPSRAESRTSLAKEPSSTHSKSRIVIPRSAERRKPKRGVSPSSPLCRAADFTIHDDTKSKRASTSTLHEVSGHEISPIPSPWSKRPRSIATSTPLKWNTDSLFVTRPSAPKDRASGQELLNCIRVSNVPIIARPLANLSVNTKQEGQPHDDLQPKKEDGIRKPKQTIFRPPSRQEFDFAPQTNLGLQIANTQIVDNNNPFSPTQFMMSLYREDGHSPDLEGDTPTRKPSSQRPTSIRPNKPRKTIFDDPIPTVWPPAIPAVEQRHQDPEKLPRDPSLQSMHSTSQASTPSSRPTSLHLNNFPWPQPPNWRGPKTPIRRVGGPRDPPFRYISPNRRRSPIRSGVGGGRWGATSPGKDLRRNVAALRRMNSDVVGSGSRKSREHKRYLSIGDSGCGGSEGGAIFEEVVEEEETEAGGEKSSTTIRPPRSRGLSWQQQAAADHYNGKENAATPTGLMMMGDDNMVGGNSFGGMTKLGPLGNNSNGGNNHNRVKKSPDGSMYDGDGFLKELDAWLR